MTRFNKKFPFHAKVTEMKKIKNARIKIVGGDKDEEEGDLTVPRYINLSECVTLADARANRIPTLLRECL